MSLQQSEVRVKRDIVYTAGRMIEKSGLKGRRPAKDMRLIYVTDETHLLAMYHASNAHGAQLFEGAALSARQ